jgi:serine protease Do
MNRAFFSGVFVTLLIVAAGAGGWLLRERFTRAEPPRSVEVKAVSASDLPQSLEAAFTSVAQHVRPAVVNIGIIQVAKARPGPAPQPGTDDPFFRDFFKQFFGSDVPPGPRGEFRQPGLGSGVIIDKRGLVLTNFHVIKGADEITIRLSDKREYRGKVLGTDARTDLALVRFDPDRELTTAPLGNSDSLRVGEWAIAIGNPFGLDQTVTVGVISATGRSEVGLATYENFIQTDASINPGNSGGPLVNLKGEVIGINTAIVAAGQGIGFAIPINMVRRVTDQLVAQGKVVRGWLGVSLQPLSRELSETLGVNGPGGALVASTIPGGPASKAGLKQNDVILSYEQTAVEDYHHLQRLVAETRVGTTVTLSVLREKKRMDIPATVAESPDESARRAPSSPKP